MGLCPGTIHRKEGIYVKPRIISSTMRMRLSCHLEWLREVHSFSHSPQYLNLKPQTNGKRARFNIDIWRVHSVVDIVRGQRDLSALSLNPSWCAPKFIQLSIHFVMGKMSTSLVVTSCACNGIGVTPTPA